MSTANEPARQVEPILAWMQAVITHPDGVEAGAASPAARRCLDVPEDDLERVVRRSRALTASERLAIYHNAYFARLIECLREEFPALTRALGREVFDAFAFDYLQRYPSRSYTLGQLGAHFSRYLEETRPADGDAGWPDFLIDLAAFEWAVNEVFDGPGAEGQPLLDAERLQAVPPQRWPEARLLAVPCLRLLRLRYPVHRYHAALRRKKRARPPQPGETFLALSRRDYVVRHYELSGPQYQLLGALLAGAAVGEAIGKAAETATDLEGLAAELREWFRSWAAAGLFGAVELPGDA
jgi:hypothetical protein